MVRIFVTALAFAALTGAAEAAKTCTGTKDLCRITLACTGTGKCMQDLNLDGTWECVSCTQPGGKLTSKPGTGKSLQTR